MRSKIFRGKDKVRKIRHDYDDNTIYRMKQYYKVEENHDTLMKYLHDHRVRHEALTKSQRF